MLVYILIIEFAITYTSDVPTVCMVQRVGNFHSIASSPVNLNHQIVIDVRHGAVLCAMRVNARTGAVSVPRLSRSDKIEPR